jgi:hypothetical protein
MIEPMQAPVPGPRVLAIQMGGRRAYVGPAALARAGMLVALYTDMTGSTGLGRLAGAVARLPMPRQATRLVANLAGRRLPAELLGRTRSFDAAHMRHRVARMMARDPTSKVRCDIAANKAMGARMLAAGFGEATHILSCLGEGADFLVEAKRRGLTVVSDVMIALSSDGIVQEEHRLFPDWGPAPFDIGKAYGTARAANTNLLETASLYLCPSDFVRDDLIANFGVPPDQTRVVPYHVNQDFLDMTPAPEPGRVLFVGSADLRKGIHYLAFAQSDLAARGVRYDFRIAGEVAEVVRDHRACAGLTFLGRVPLARIGAEFNAADVLVLPSVA